MLKSKDFKFGITNQGDAGLQPQARKLVHLHFAETAPQGEELRHAHQREIGPDAGDSVLRGCGILPHQATSERGF